jgi:FKBP-type peptidyl-prolyl cis-trans isomerase
MDMKLQLVVVALCAVFVASQAVAAEKIQLKTDQDKLSYQKGVYLGDEFKKRSIEVDRKIFLRGVEDALSGAETLLTIQEMVTIEENFQKERAAKQQEERKRLSEKNKKEGEAFLTANAKKDGVKTLSNGLQYIVIKEGKGKRPRAENKVKVHYVMTRIDGTVLDDSTKRGGQPAVMPVGGDPRYVPAGWTESLQLMNEGSKWKIYCPSSLGFGENGYGVIGPNEVMIFEVELLSIESPKAEKGVKGQEKKN